jgi:dipeptidase D
MVKSYHDSVDIDITIRSMDNEELVHLLDETIHYFENFGAVVTSEGFYSPWTPKENILTKLVFDASEEVFGSKTALGAIHAGLECGILGEKMPNLLMASIGPDIVYPHSTREAVDINSVERVFEVVKKVLKKL